MTANPNSNSNSNSNSTQATTGAELSLTFVNESSVAATVGVLLVDPNNNSEDGLPVVWISIAVDPNASTSFKWGVNWGLSLGFTHGDLPHAPCDVALAPGDLSLPLPLAPGVQFWRDPYIAEVSPEAGQPNFITITYANDRFTFYGGKLNILFPTRSVGTLTDKNFPTGSLGALSDGSFTNAQAQSTTTCILMTMCGRICYAVPLRPSFSYTFGARPTYYLSLQLPKESAAASASAITTATKVVFVDGTFTYTIPAENHASASTKIKTKTKIINSNSKQQKSK